MKLILTRHGETVENVNHIVQGSKIQGRLTSLGIRQAKKLAQRLKNDKIDHIYSSNLNRAADTAKEIAKFHPNTPIYFVEELREFDMGSKSGTVAKKNQDNSLSNLASDAESFSSLQKRIKKLLDKVYSKYPNGTVLFVGHGHINKALLTVINNQPANQILNYDTQDNTAISTFEIKEDKNHIVHLLNCTKHLD